jgi:anaerobic dimethyl sulfoxide reductase subunit B (iron-sulfur subunit)
MAKQYGFYVEVDKCAQCHACQVACKATNNVELGVSWRKVTTEWKGQFPNVTNQTISLACMHCADAACAKVCAVGAITKRADDGIVVVDQSKCIGCKACSLACPFGVPQFGKDTKMQKCNLCVDRLQAGKQPACVWTCPGGALHAGTMEDLAKLGQPNSAKQLAGVTQPSVLISGTK